MTHISFISVIYEHPVSVIMEMIDSIINVMSYNSPFQYTSPFEYDIILVNNDGDSRDILKDAYDRCNIYSYCPESNLGYCGGNNFGISKSNSEYIFIINPDVVIKDSLCIDWMLSFAKMYNGISGRLVGTEKWYTYSSSFPTDKKYHPDELPFFNNEPTLNKPGKWRPFKYIDGALMCFSRKLFDAVGGFDENIFPGYFGENIFCFKSFLLGHPILDANIENFYSHNQHHTSNTKIHLVDWAREARKYFYKEYALPNWSKFLQYVG